MQANRMFTITDSVIARITERLLSREGPFLREFSADWESVAENSWVNCKNELNSKKIIK